ncbi:hypothetical protein [Paracoccus laeviglucosivorans]|uniref:Uncharacterized protein n=1 Tax=Paracoccus laeviglucosivorans TaxID=1197861 RepID=A0A521FFB3_9RHOB|nr:hypothetical protein [Paracoccus laeviglucosivorans]SMO94674.1 hypothetical protein SAMN06265221_12139 [Paracoccus laeviglucosivorans]
MSLRKIIADRVSHQGTDTDAPSADLQFLSDDELGLVSGGQVCFGRAEFLRGNGHNKTTTTGQCE